MLHYPCACSTPKLEGQPVALLHRPASKLVENIFVWKPPPGLIELDAAPFPEPAFWQFQFDGELT